MVFLEGDVSGVVQPVLDVPMALDRRGGMARRDGGVGDVVSDLGGTVPQAGLGIAMQDIAGDADDPLDQGLPLGCGNGGGCIEYLGRPGLLSAARGGNGGVSAGGLAQGTGGFDILQQVALIVLQLDEDECVRLCGGFEGFFWQCMASSVTMQCAT